ncbi:copper chaperone [Parasulfuritortus cantonensis]|uniref:Copper chaperone n=1 Tax=Parasulfuritortus cantonensis TaxID=2528202 RepID=A0A4R1B8D3_9PROT|nr:heavy-metal-associated domain-containing protein [Parasulfuritortus cantonensis]TCJ13198.1 copper chaperone [Parasulfuritortus cantonensis]
METITLNVGGMSCMGCVNSVKRLLEPLPGVAEVTVELTPGSARIVYDPAKVAPAALRQAIVEGGYTVAD